MLDRFDVFALSEHWLFGEQLYKISNYSCDFTGHRIASQSNLHILSGRRGHEVVRILWSTAFSDFALPLSIDSDRVTGVKLITPDHQSLFVHPTTQLTLFKRHLTCCGLFMIISATRVSHLFWKTSMVPLVILVVTEFHKNQLIGVGLS